MLVSICYIAVSQASKIMKRDNSLPLVFVHPYKIQSVENMLSLLVTYERCKRKVEI